MPILVGDLSGIGQGIQTAGGALAGALERRAESRLQQQQASALDQALAEADLTSQEGQQDFLRQAVSQNVPIQDALGVLDRAIKSQSNRPMSTEEIAGLKRTMVGLGVPDKQAEDFVNLYGQATTGGRTELIKMGVDLIQRHSSPSDLSDVEPKEEGFAFPEVEMFKGLTPKEKVSREKELFNANSKDFSEISKKTKSLKSESLKLDQLKRLNDTGKLPEGLENLNINWKTGDIRVPRFANSATQQYVKTVKDFLTNIKDSFGARITDFDIKSFMQRLPTLANSTEGRRVIIDQMKAISDIDKLYYDSFKEVYDEYGLRGIDSQKAEKIASELRAPKEEVLKQKVADSIMAQEVYDAKEVVPEGKVVGMSPEGKIIFIWKNKADKAIERGYRIL